MDSDLRLGDVLEWEFSATPYIENDFKMNLGFPKFSVVLTPCCSVIDESVPTNTVSLTPLIKLKNSFFKNPYWKEDFTRLNRRMKPEHTLAPEHWDGLPPEKKAERLAKREGYVLNSIFVYESNDFFPKYTIHSKGETNPETNYYMINFKYAFRIDTKKSFESPRNTLRKRKLLQLSIETRSELREKLSDFYFRIPKEDTCELDY